MEKALRQAALALVTLSAVALALSTGIVGSTFALFNGETQNAGSSFAGGWVGAPSALTTTAGGYDVTLNWTPGTHGPVNGQKLNGVDNGTGSTGSNCTGAAWALISTLASTATNTYSDARRASAVNNGDWFCYQLVSTSTTVWTAQASQAVQIGLVANGLSTANAAAKCSGAPNTASGKVDCNDTITITFNQKPILPSSPIQVCVWSTGSIVLGDTHGGGCHASNDTLSVGTIALSGATLGSNAAYGSSPYTLSTSAPWIMTITLAGSTSTSAITGSPTWAFTPLGTIKSSITAHQATICSAATPTCQPTSSTTF